MAEKSFNPIGWLGTEPDLKQLLVKLKFQELGGNTLFKDVNEIIDKLKTSDKSTVKQKSTNYIRSQVYSILRGDKFIDGEFHSSLMLIIENKVNNNPVLLKKIVARLNLNTKERVTEDDPNLFSSDNLKVYSSSLFQSEEIYILTRKPAELETLNDPFIRRISDLTINSIVDFLSTNQMPCFKYFFPNEIGESFWRTLTKQVALKIETKGFENLLVERLTKLKLSIKKSTIENSAIFLNFLNRTQQKILVFKVEDAGYFVLNHTIFNPKSKLTRKGFLHYSPKLFDLKEMEESDIEYWNTMVYPQILKQEQNNRCKVEFDLE